MGLNDDAVFVLIFLSAFPIMYVSIFPVPNSLYTYRKNGSFFSNISFLLEYTYFVSCEISMKIGKINNSFEM